MCKEVKCQSQFFFPPRDVLYYPTFRPTGHLQIIKNVKALQKSKQIIMINKQEKNENKMAVIS
jgi:hypothetical protein